MPTILSVESTVIDGSAWESKAKELFDAGPVGIMEKVDGTFTIFARVVGYTEDPTWGRLIQVERADTGGSLSTPALADPQLPS